MLAEPFYELLVELGVLYYAARCDVEQVLDEFEVLFYDMPLACLTVFVYGANVKQGFRRDVMMQDMVAKQRLSGFDCYVYTRHATWHFRFLAGSATQLEPK